MRAKPDLMPDCDIHGEPMYRDECPAQLLGLEGSRDLIIWRCSRTGCGRYFYGTVGYRSIGPATDPKPPTPQCDQERAFLVVQRDLGCYICPVTGCSTVQIWQAVRANPQLRHHHAAR
jgi:hypothetical protein